MTTLTAVCLTHRHAPLELLERFPRGEDLHGAMQSLRLLPGVRGCLFLSTCNRFEVYVTSDRALSRDEIVECVAPSVRGPRADWADLLQAFTGADAVRHLFAVSAGLESRLVGEHEILGQVRASAQSSAQADCLDIELATLSQWAVRAGRRARRAVGTAGGHRSVADLSVAVLSRMLGDLAGTRVLVIGAGHLAARASRLLAGADATTIVCARDVDKARLATTATSVVPLELLPLLLGAVDAVVCATSAREPVLTAAMLRSSVSDLDRRPLVVLDLGLPRNVETEVVELPHVVCLDLDALAMCDDPQPAGGEAAGIAQRVVDAEATAYAVARSERHAAALLEQIARRGQQIRETEILRVSGRLTADELAAADEVTRRVVNKLLHPILTGVRAAVAAGDTELAIAAARVLCDDDVTRPRGEDERDEDRRSRAS